MGIGRLIGQWIGERQKRKRTEELERRLSSFGLSEEEIEEVRPYIDYVAENDGGIGTYVALAALGFVGVLAVLFGALAGRLPLPIQGLFLVGGLFFVGLPGVIYRKKRKAANVKQALLSNPEAFVNDEPHPYHSIKNE